MKKTGTVKWFDESKGCGVIHSCDGSGDVFVLKSEVEKAGLKTLNKGERLTYDFQTNPISKKIRAANLNRLI